MKTIRFLSSEFFLSAKTVSIFIASIGLILFLGAITLFQVNIMHDITFFQMNIVNLDSFSQAICHFYIYGKEFKVLHISLKVVKPDFMYFHAITDLYVLLYLPINVISDYFIVIHCKNARTLLNI